MIYDPGHNQKNMCIPKIQAINYTTSQNFRLTLSSVLFFVLFFYIEAKIHQINEQDMCNYAAKKNNQKGIVLKHDFIVSFLILCVHMYYSRDVCLEKLIGIKEKTFDSIPLFISFLSSIISLFFL